jgi:hypothetical protein
MAFVSGTAGSVTYVSGGTPIITGVHEWSLDVGQDTPEVTAFGDGWRVYINGIKEWSGSFALYKNPAGTAQDFVRNMLVGGSVPIVFQFYGGTNYYSGSAMPTKAAPAIAYDGVWEDSYDIQGSGPLSYT